MNFMRGWMLIMVVLLTACGPSEKQKAQIAEQRRIECLDKFCDGDIEPKHDMLNEVAFKLNGRWFIGPRKYGNPNFGAIAFYWPSKVAKGDATEIHYAKEALKNRVGGIDNYFDIAIELFLRSGDIPSPPYGYALIELAQRSGWIAERRTLRPGLDVVRMKSVIGPQGRSISHVTYYVATNLLGVDGLPPVASCSHDDPRNGGGSGFMWKPGIWAGIRMNQRHCVDWPEIYQETARVLQLLREAP